MAGELTVEFDDADWQKFLTSLIGASRNFDKYLIAAFNTRGFRDIIEHFQKEEGPDGAWKKRSSFTQRLYDAISAGEAQPAKGVPRGSYSSSNKVLQLTGRMRQSVARPGGNVRRLSNDSIMIFSNVEYAGKHDEGDPSNRLPKREFMWLSDEAQDDIGQILLNSIVGEADNAV